MGVSEGMRKLILVGKKNDLPDCRYAKEDDRETLSLLPNYTLIFSIDIRFHLGRDDFFPTGTLC